MSPLGAATIAEGVLGLEAYHIWNGLTMNSKNAFPRYNLTRINGLRSKGDTDDLREPARGSTGEITWGSQARGKTVVYTGFVEADNLVDLRIASNNMQAAFADNKSEHVLTVSPPSGRGGVSWNAVGKALSCDIDDEQTREMGHPRVHARAFTASIRLSDPRFYGAQTSISGADGATVAANNLGTAPADIAFWLNGPISAGGVYLQRPGYFLDFKASALWAPINSGKQLVIEFGRTPRAYSPQVAGDFASLLEFESNWWDDMVDSLPPGATNITVSGASWTMYFNPTSW